MKIAVLSQRLFQARVFTNLLQSGLTEPLLFAKLSLIKYECDAGTANQSSASDWFSALP